MTADAAQAGHRRDGVGEQLELTPHQGLVVATESREVREHPSDREATAVFEGVHERSEFRRRDPVPSHACVDFDVDRQVAPGRAR